MSERSLTKQEPAKIYYQKYPEKLKLKQELAKERAREKRRARATELKKTEGYKEQCSLYKEIAS